MTNAQPISASTTTDPDDLTDPDTFGRWYGDNWRPAVAYAHRLSRDASLAEDLAAEALVRCWQRWQVTGTPERPFAYVATAIRNRAASHFRRAQQDRPPLHGVQEPVGSPESSVVDRDAVQGVLERLPLHERTAVVLHYLEDRSCDEIAEQLAVRPATVRTQLHRARRRLTEAAAA